MSRFDQIYYRYHRQLLLFSLKFVEREADALDIVQEVFISVWATDRLNYDEAHLKSYLFQATRNRCLNYLKHQGIMRQYEKNAALQLRQIELVHYQSGEKSLIETESVDRINQAIESLSDVQKEVILLSRFDGLSNQEIADKLGIPVRTVETRIFRALQKLREKITSTGHILLMVMGFFRRSEKMN